MARSHAVWIVTHDNLPLASFTVKHELVTYLKRFAISDVRIFKLPDGTPIRANIQPDGSVSYERTEPQEFKLEDLV